MIKLLNVNDFPDQDRLRLIECFYYCYYNTNQDIKVFAEEFYEVVGWINNNCVPVELTYLTDFIEYGCEASEVYKKKYGEFLQNPSIALKIEED